MQRQRGNRSAAGQVLGLQRNYLVKLLRDLGLQDGAGSAAYADRRRGAPHPHRAPILRDDGWRVRFVKDWNAGLANQALREKYGLGYDPGVVASKLRRQGYAAIYRAARTRVAMATRAASALLEGKG